jgi:hypothetical protein
MAATQFSVQYIPDRFLPDKAIDLIDDACSLVRLKGVDFSSGQEESRIEKSQPDETNWNFSKEISDFGLTFESLHFLRLASAALTKTTPEWSTLLGTKDPNRIWGRGFPDTTLIQEDLEYFFQNINNTILNDLLLHDCLDFKDINSVLLDNILSNSSILEDSLELSLPQSEILYYKSMVEEYFDVCIEYMFLTSEFPKMACEVLSVLSSQKMNFNESTISFPLGLFHDLRPHLLLLLDEKFYYECTCLDFYSSLVEFYLNTDQTQGV